MMEKKHKHILAKALAFGAFVPLWWYGANKIFEWEMHGTCEPSTQHAYQHTTTNKFDGTQADTVRFWYDKVSHYRLMNGAGAEVIQDCVKKTGAQRDCRIRSMGVRYDNPETFESHEGKGARVMTREDFENYIPNCARKNLENVVRDE